MSDKTLSSEFHSSRELTAINKKRDALEQIVKISLTISRLQTSLQSVVLMGKPSSQVPQSALRLYKSLSDGVTHYSNQKLQESLTAIETRVKDNIAKVVMVAQASDEIDENEIDSQDFDDLNKLLHEFQRRAQTAVALNLLLHKRGVTPKELSFHLPEDLINSTIHNLDEKEQKCKSEMKSQITEMQGDIDTLLSSDSLPEGMRQELLSMKDSFALNLKHIESGKTLEDMPIVIEMVEMGSMEDHTTPYEPAANTEVNKPDSEKDSAKPKSKQKRGFFSKTKEWMSTSFDVKWKDIE